MTNVHIDQATTDQLDYAVAVARGWMTIDEFDVNQYRPTADQDQCGELIDKSCINGVFHNTGHWELWVINHKSATDKSRLIAACKAFLWSVYSDGMIPGA